jgi:hypothetical protein
MRPTPAAPAGEARSAPASQPDDPDADGLAALAGVVSQVIATQQGAAAAQGYGAGPSKASPSHGAPAATAYGSGQGFVGSWSCRWSDSSGGSVNETPLSIRPAGSGYEAIIEGDRLTGQQTGPDRVRLQASGQRQGSGYSASFDFQSQGSTLVGGGEIRVRDEGGTHAERYSGRCGRVGS